MTNDNKIKDLLSSSPDNGEWEFTKKEDPFTDEITYYICKNSNDRHSNIDGTAGSESMLCLTYLPEASKIKILLGVLNDIQYNPAEALVRFDKNKPLNLSLDVEEISGNVWLVLNHPFTFINHLRKSNKLAIKIMDYGKRDGKEKVYLFNLSPEIFKQVSEPIADKF